MKKIISFVVVLAILISIVFAFDFKKTDADIEISDTVNLGETVPVKLTGSPSKEVKVYFDNELYTTSKFNLEGILNLEIDSLDYEVGKYHIYIEGDGFKKLEKIEIFGENSFETQKVKKKINCYNETSYKEKKIIGDCSNSREITICEDEPINNSCYETVEEYSYKCVTGTEKIPLINKICSEVKEIKVDDKYQLSVDNFECSSTEKNQIVTLICDSRIDGNGDGICQSGESCQKIVLDGDNVETYFKNSRPDFVKSDKTFVQRKIKITELEE